VAAILIATVPGAAMAAEVCNPNTSDPPRFCVNGELALSTTVATKPVNIGLTFDNTSPNEELDSNEWLEQATLRLLSTVVPPPTVTASSDLPDKLLISGEPLSGTACTNANHFVGCTAGYGTLIGYLSGAPFGNGIKHGDYGIHRIVNLQATSGPGVLAHYRVAIEGCLDDIPFIGRYCTPQEVDVEIPKPPVGTAIEMALDTRYQFSPAGGVNLDVALSSVNFHLGGDSSKLEDGTAAGGSFTVIRMPQKCGTLSGEGLFEAGDQTRTVTLPSSFPVNGCTKTTVRAVAKAKIKPRGKVKSTVVGDPPVTSGTVKVDLFKKKKTGGFKHLASANAPIDANGKYKTAFPKPHAKKCKVVSKFGGDPLHASSKGSKKFGCR
jgi:hypothetical protein